MTRNAWINGKGVVIVIAVFMTLSALPASAMQLEVLRHKLAERGAGWLAAETSLSHLSTEEFGRMLGFVPAGRVGAVRQPGMAWLRGAR
jgi:hypothetical protein